MIKYLLPALVCLQAFPAAEPHLNDTELEDLAKQALASNKAKVQADALHQLQVHHFKSSQAGQREVCLFAQGILEDRLGQPGRAAVTLHKLEVGWPSSVYLPEAQVILAQAAADHSHYKEAEQRLHKAMTGDLPVESQRRAQELFLWVLADQGRASEGIDTVNGLRPLGSAKPTEKGLVGIMEAFCAAHKRADAQSALTQYKQHFPRGPRVHRVELDFARLLGTLGEAGPSALAFQKLIVTAPEAPEADEARLALATLLAEGRLSAKEAQALPSPRSLLAELDKAGLKDADARQAMVLKLRVALKDRQWEEALHDAAQARALHPTEAELLQVAALRQEALRGWIQELLDKHQTTAALPYLSGEAITALTPAQRQGLAVSLAQAGLPEASQQLMNASPAAERPVLRRAILAVTGKSDPRGALAFLPDKGGSPEDALTRAEAAASQGDWTAAGASLAKARPGPERIRLVLALVSRAADPKEPAGARLKEAEHWLSRAPEKGAVREPLAILVADLKTRAGDWKGALAAYPARPEPGSLGWVALMRATCLARLGRAAAAREALAAAKDEPAFKPERDALAQRLSR